MTCERLWVGGREPEWRVEDKAGFLFHFTFVCIFSLFLCEHILLHHTNVFSMTHLALFTVLSNQDRYFEVSFRERVNTSAVGKEKLCSLSKKLLNYYHHLQPRGKYSTPIITVLLRNHSLTFWVKKKKVP